MVTVAELMRLLAGCAAGDMVAVDDGGLGISVLSTEYGTVEAEIEIGGLPPKCFVCGRYDAAREFDENDTEGRCPECVSMAEGEAALRKVGAEDAEAMEAYRAYAREDDSPELQIDEDAEVHLSESGAYVRAMVWVDATSAGRCYKCHGALDGEGYNGLCGDCADQKEAGCDCGKNCDRDPDEDCPDEDED